MPEPPANDQSQAVTEPNPNDDTIEFDELSGRTLSHPGPWKQMLSDRRKAKQQAFSTNTQPAPGKPNSSPRVSRAPRLPDTDYKVVYRPRDGLRIAAWSDRQLTASVQKASRIPEGAFNQRVVIQVQTVQNLIVASTPYETYADPLSNVTLLQLEDATYEISPYVKPFPGTVRGVIHGLDPGTTTEQLPNIIASPGPKIQQARMLGKSTSAVVTFEGPHIPFYIHAHGLYTRCRPYRHSIQCCSLCGDIGHRRDICPNPEVTVCERCHERNPAPEHTCTPKCKLCGLDHLTASKDCRNLRPISLTSCVGKLLEHMVQNRLSPYIEVNGHFPTAMYGFRPHLSTQDVLLQLKEEIIDRLTSTHKRCILALDIKGAFDISHQAILQGLTSIDCGQRTYDYIKAFLTGRTATIGIGHLRSNTFKTISKGTPQGSVISPLLFNIAMKDLPPLLQNIPHLRHAIYADDLTLWTPTGSMVEDDKVYQVYWAGDARTKGSFYDAKVLYMAGNLVLNSVFLHGDLAARPYRAPDFRDALSGVIDRKDVIAMGQYQMSHVRMVVCATSLAKSKLVSCEELKVKGKKCLVVEPESKEVKLRLLWLPPHMENRRVVEALEPFGAVRSIV
ncbi:hypothetical protein ISCGN_023398 [Ixodes scapularis]